MNSFLFTVASFVVALGILITAHEFGHFWVARRLGVKVLRFSIGFGKPLWSKTFGPDQTEFVIAAIPLGGYVKMLDEREGAVAEDELERAFNRKPLGVRTAVVLAGPVFNLLFAMLLYWIIFMVGDHATRPVIGSVVPDSVAEQAGFHEGDLIVAIEDRQIESWESFVLALVSEGLDHDTVTVGVRTSDDQSRRLELQLGAAGEDALSSDVLGSLGLVPARPKLPAVLGKLEPGGPAEQAGLVSGDRIVAVDEQRVGSWSEWVEIVRASPGQDLRVQVDRDGVVQQYHLRPDRMQSDAEEIGRIGAYAHIPDDLPNDLRITIRYSPLAAFWRSGQKTVELSVLTLRMIGRLLIGQASPENVSGPITIAQHAGATARIGVIPFLKFLAIVSISLGVLNLLPIPVLDGGHLMYYLVELLKGSPVSEQVQAMGQRVGLVLLVMLMGLAFYQDFERLID